MNIYRVDCHFSLYVYSADPEDAREEIRDMSSFDLGDMAAEAAFVCREPIADIDRIPRAWRDAIPHGETGERTIAQILTPDTPSEAKG
jgi:hypothetical protein